MAEFDIEVGSSLTRQYPEDLLNSAKVTSSVNEKYGYPSTLFDYFSMLAELMLPDGAHLREEDWTVFFLNQSTYLNV